MHASATWGPRPNGPCLQLTRHLVATAPLPSPGLGRHRAGRQLRLSCAAASQRNLYEVLGITQSASEREVKSAYRKKALKLHPDVNKAPDAQQQFMEAKMAFETLSDTNQRAEYDRQLRMGFGSAADWRSRKTAGSSSSSGWGSSAGWGGSGSYGTGGKRPTSQPEDNYTFEDLMRDLDKELNSWMKDKSGPGGRPKSLLEELEALGGEFVDFLEDVAGVKDSKSSGGSSGSSGSSGSDAKASSSSSSSSSSKTSGGSESSSSGRKKSPMDEFDEIWSQFASAVDGATKGATGQTSSNTYNSNNTSSSGSSGAGSSSSTYKSSSSSTYSSGGGAASSARPGAGASTAKLSDDDIDAMLAELKRKVKRDGP